MSRMKIRYIEHCTTDGCKTKRPVNEKAKSGYVCYRCNRKAERAGMQKKA